MLLWMCWKGPMYGEKPYYLSRFWISKKLVAPVVNREAIGVGKIFWHPESAGEWSESRFMKATPGQDPSLHSGWQRKGIYHRLKRRWACGSCDIWITYWLWLSHVGNWRGGRSSNLINPYDFQLVERPIHILGTNCGQTWKNTCHPLFGEIRWIVGG